MLVSFFHSSCYCPRYWYDERFAIVAWKFWDIIFQDNWTYFIFFLNRQSHCLVVAWKPGWKCTFCFWLGFADTTLGKVEFWLTLPCCRCVGYIVSPCLSLIDNLLVEKGTDSHHLIVSSCACKLSSLLSLADTRGKKVAQYLPSTHSSVFLMLSCGSSASPVPPDTKEMGSGVSTSSPLNHLLCLVVASGGRNLAAHLAPLTLGGCLI